MYTQEFLNKIEGAKYHGEKTFYAGKPRVPVQDAQFMDMCKQINEIQKPERWFMLPLLDAWMQGWDTASLESQEKTA